MPFDLSPIALYPLPLPGSFWLWKILYADLEFIFLWVKRMCRWISWWNFIIAFEKPPEKCLYPTDKSSSFMMNLNYPLSIGRKIVVVEASASPRDNHFGMMSETCLEVLDIIFKNCQPTLIRTKFNKNFSRERTQLSQNVTFYIH